jgi:hypothetical protein
MLEGVKPANCPESRDNPKIPGGSPSFSFHGNYIVLLGGSSLRAASCE